MSWTRVRAVVMRHHLAQNRQPAYWFLMLVLPLVDAVLFSSIGVAYGEGGDSVELLITGVMLFHLMWHLTLNTSAGLLEEVYSSNVLNLMTTPLRESEFVAGLTVLSLARTAVTLAVIAVAGGVFYGVDASTAGLTLLPGMAILLVFGWAVSLAVLASVLRWGETAEVFSWGIILLLMPLAGIFYPIDALPGALQPISNALPVTRVFEAMRVGASGGGVAWGDLGIALLGTSVVGIVCVAVLVRGLRTFRRKGLVTNFS